MTSPSRLSWHRLLRANARMFTGGQCLRLVVVIGHFGHKTLRHQNTSDPHETLQRHLKTLLLQKRGTRRFGIRSAISRDTLDPGQSRQDTAPLVIRFKVGAEVSWLLVPKCPVAEVSGSPCPHRWVVPERNDGNRWPLASTQPGMPGTHHPRQCFGSG